MQRALTVLIVEGDPLLLDALTFTVGFAGYAALGAKNSADALHVLETIAVGLACLDLALPGVDGAELARRIRERPGGAEIILVALSGARSQLDAAYMLGLGFRDVIEKPIEAAVLVQRLARLLPLHRVELSSEWGRSVGLDAEPDQPRLVDPF